jgi:hypothetical protein
VGLAFLSWAAFPVPSGVLQGPWVSLLLPTLPWVLQSLLSSFWVFSAWSWASSCPFSFQGWAMAEVECLGLVGGILVQAEEAAAVILVQVVVLAEEEAVILAAAAPQGTGNEVSY